MHKKPVEPSVNIRWPLARLTHSQDFFTLHVCQRGCQGTTVVEFYLHMAHVSTFFLQFLSSVMAHARWLLIRGYKQFHISNTCPNRGHGMSKMGGCLQGVMTVILLVALVFWKSDRLQEVVTWGGGVCTSLAY